MSATVHPSPKAPWWAEPRPLTPSDAETSQRLFHVLDVVLHDDDVLMLLSDVLRVLAGGTLEERQRLVEGIEALNNALLDRWELGEGAEE